MLSLGKELHQTIRNLEKVRDSQTPPSNKILEKLDLLYAQQIKLIDAAIKTATVEYEDASKSMNAAAKKTQEAIADLQKLEQAITAVANAIAKVTHLLASIV